VRNRFASSSTKCKQQFDRFFPFHSVSNGKIAEGLEQPVDVDQAQLKRASARVIE
jgi:hypothetical protein